MNKIEIEVPFFSIEQPGGVFYYTKIQSHLIKDRLIVRNRSKQEDGVQRDLNKKRSNEISEYLDLPDAVIPTPIVISISAERIKKPDSESLPIILSTDENGIFGEIIDGQHRYEGLRKNLSFSEYQVPICIFIELSLEDKASIFSTINSTQVKVPKSYIYDLFDYSEINTPIKFCHDVCKTLNYEETGPLFRRIKMLGKKLGDEETLSQAAFIDAFLPLITNDVKKDEVTLQSHSTLDENLNLPLRRLYIDRNITVFAKIISNYLTALQKVATKNWETYVLRSIGIKVFARLLADIAPTGLKSNNLSVEFFHTYLSKIELEINSCSASNGTNKGVENKTVENLRQSLVQNG